MTTDDLSALTLDQLRLFVAVVDEGSFSAAGRRLNRVQSAVSYGIANLERLLGLALFDRTGRRPVLTEAGGELLSDARQVLARVGRLSSRASSMREGVEPEVSLAVDAIFPATSLVQICRAFQQRYPQVSLRLRTDVLSGVADRVRRAECMIGISGVSPEHSAGLDRRFVRRIAVIPVASAAHALARPERPLSDADLREEVQIVISETGTPKSGGEAREIVSQRTWRVADITTKLALIRAGLGWGHLPHASVVEDLASGALHQLELTSRGGEPGIGTLVALTRSDARLGPAGGWLLEALPDLCAAS